MPPEEVWTRLICFYEPICPIGLLGRCFWLSALFYYQDCSDVLGTQWTLWSRRPHQRRLQFPSTYSHVRSGPVAFAVTDRCAHINPASTPSATPTVPATGATSGETRSDKERVTNASVSGSDLTDLVSGNSAFAFDLYHALGEKDGNLFYSPYSISVALAMTYAGARGETERQMADTMHYRLSQESFTTR